MAEKVAAKTQTCNCSKNYPTVSGHRSDCPDFGCPCCGLTLKEHPFKEVTRDGVEFVTCDCGAKLSCT